MIITDVKVRVFRTTSKLSRDNDGHAHPGPETETRMGLLTVIADGVTEGHVLCPPAAVRRELVESYVRPVLIGRDPLMREQLWNALARWQRGSGGQLSDRTLSYVDQALWDLTGRILGAPVWKLLGGYRDKIPAYGSTMCGDELEGGLKTPEDYGRFAEWMVKERGYQAVKLHTWMPPVSFAPSVKMDIKACAAVREAVGPDVPLMLDASHWYSRMEALELGRGIQDLGYCWIEEPMEEASMSSYRWLSENLDIPVIGPESAAGKHYTRGEWAAAGACDILRVGALGAGGITPALKTVHLAEGFNMDCEIHGNGAANLALAGGMPNSRWYERGLLHPFTNYDEPAPHLNSLVDAMDEDGFVPMPSAPGLGEDINFGYIKDNTVERW